MHGSPKATVRIVDPENIIPELTWGSNETSRLSVTWPVRPANRPVPPKIRPMFPASSTLIPEAPGYCIRNERLSLKSA